MIITHITVLATDYRRCRHTIIGGGYLLGDKANKDSIEHDHWYSKGQDGHNLFHEEVEVGGEGGLKDEDREDGEQDGIRGDIGPDVHTLLEDASIHALVMAHPHQATDQQTEQHENDSVRQLDQFGQTGSGKDA